MEWGDLATSAQAAGSLAPAWKKFIKTKFFVAIQRSPDDNPKNYLLHMVRNAADGTATLLVAEVRERLDPRQGDGIVALSGADIVCRVEEQASIDVALREGVFSISAKRVEWLRSGIEMTRTRVAIRQRLRAAAPAAPLPVLRTEPEAAAVAAALPARRVKPALVASGALGVLAAIVVAMMNMAPNHTSAPAPFEAAIPRATAVPAPSAAAAPVKPTVPFTAAYNSFTVILPGLAEEVEQPPDQARRSGDIETHLYRLRLDDLVYTMEASIYRAGTPRNDPALMDAAQETIVGKDGTLIRAMPVALRGAGGREVRVRLANGGERAARFAFIGNKFCLVMVMAPHGERAAVQMDAFLNSFQLN